PRGGPPEGRDRQRADRDRACRTPRAGPRIGCLWERPLGRPPPSCREWGGGVRGVSSWLTSWQKDDGHLKPQDSPSSQASRRARRTAFAPLHRTWCIFLPQKIFPVVYYRKQTLKEMGSCRVTQQSLMWPSPHSKWVGSGRVPLQYVSPIPSLEPSMRLSPRTAHDIGPLW